MKRHIPYFSFYPSDFMNGVRGLTPQDVGVYTMILCRIYEENGPVEYHPRRLATYCGMREASFVKVAEKLIDLGKLTLSDGKIHNGRARDEIAKRANDLETASRAGKASAKKRQEKQASKSTPVEGSFNHSNTDTDTNIRKEETNVSYVREAPLLSLAHSAPPDRFEEFWESYPHRNGAKKGKDKARDSWRRAIKGGASQSEIISAAIRHHQDRAVIEGYARNPSTWLNQKGWKDEIEPASNSNRNSRAPQGRENRPDAALANIARLAGLG